MWPRRIIGLAQCQTVRTEGLHPSGDEIELYVDMLGVDRPSDVVS